MLLTANRPYQLFVLIQTTCLIKQQTTTNIFTSLLFLFHQKIVYKIFSHQMKGYMYFKKTSDIGNTQCCLKDVLHQYLRK